MDLSPCKPLLGLAGSSSLYLDERVAPLLAKRLSKANALFPAQEILSLSASIEKKPFERQAVEVQGRHVRHVARTQTFQEP